MRKVISSVTTLKLVWVWKFLPTEEKKINSCQRLAVAVLLTPPQIQKEVSGDLLPVIIDLGWNSRYTLRSVNLISGKITVSPQVSWSEREKSAKEKLTEDITMLIHHYFMSADIAILNKCSEGRVAPGWNLVDKIHRAITKPPRADLGHVDL